MGDGVVDQANTHILQAAFVMLVWLVPAAGLVMAAWWLGGRSSRTRRDPYASHEASVGLRARLSGDQEWWSGPGVSAAEAIQAGSLVVTLVGLVLFATLFVSDLLIAAVAIMAMKEVWGNKLGDDVVCRPQQRETLLPGICAPSDPAPGGQVAVVRSW
jgi:hypothetical protein